MPPQQIQVTPQDMERGDVTLTKIAYDRDTTELPDKDGNPVREGDWIRDDKGRDWLVVGLEPRESYEGHLGAKNGFLDLDYSTLRVARFRGDSIASFVGRLNFTGKIDTGFALPNVTKLNLSAAEVFERDLERADTLLSNLEQARVAIDRRVRDAERVRTELLRKGSAA